MRTAWSVPYEIFISLRYLRAKLAGQRSVSVISVISTAGVAVASWR